MPAMNGTESTLHGRSTGSGDVIHVTSERHVNTLATDILNPDRYYPIICLTARVGESAPALDPERVRFIIGPYIPIYVITRFFLASKLLKLLPRQLGVHSGAARVWWPDVDQGSASAEHPRFFNPTKRDAEMEAYQRLAAEFHVPEHPERGPAGVSTERIARVCAMVACRRAAQTGSEPHPLRRNPSPTAPQWERADGATAWRCALKGSAGGPRLHYWQLPDGTIEFALVVAHDDFSIPGG